MEDALSGRDSKCPTQRPILRRVASLRDDLQAGRATLGTIPYVALGARLNGPEGGYGGIIVGALIFGLAAMAAALLVTARLARRAALPSVQDARA